MPLSFVAYQLVLNRRLGGESNREIEIRPACMILSLGIQSEISPPWRGACPWVWCLTCVMKCNRKLFSEIVEYLWCFLDVFWTLLVRSDVVCRVFSSFSCRLPCLFPGAALPLVPLGLKTPAKHMVSSESKCNQVRTMSSRESQ